MSAQHTPGEWRYDASGPFNPTCDFQILVGMPDYDNLVVADVYYRGVNNPGESEANARLIAAAPTMLAALQRIASEKQPSYHDCIDNGEIQCAWCDGQEAIAKALGQ